MKKNILIISSKGDFSHTFYSTLKSLSDDYSFSLWSPAGSMNDFFKDMKWKTKKAYLYRNLFQAGKISNFLFFALKPLYAFIYFFKFLYLKHKDKNTTVVLLDLNAKIILSPIAKLLKIKLTWFETQNHCYNKLNKRLRNKYIKLARENKIISLNNSFREKIEHLGVPRENISLINPGIKYKHKKYQENIFSKIAHTESQQIGKKFFTIGTITDLDSKDKIETLFSAFKNSMEIIPRMQLIIVGEGEYSPDKNPWAKWLAKKMGIDTMVWFVTDTRNIKKWLDSFDIFVLSSRIFNLDDFKTCLYAMDAKLAPLVPSGNAYEDLIKNAKNGYFYEINDSLSLSELIIKYYKNKRLSIELGNNAQEYVNNYFPITKTIEEFKKIL